MRSGAPLNVSNGRAMFHFFKLKQPSNIVSRFGAAAEADPTVNIPDTHAPSARPRSQWNYFSKNNN